VSGAPPDILEIVETHVAFNRHLGIKGERIEKGFAVLLLPVRPEFLGDPRRPALHGGVLSALIDTAGGVAAWSALNPPETVSTVDLRVDYLEPADLRGPLRAEAVLVRKGNRVCHVRIRLTQEGVAVAEGTGVYNIHRGKKTEEP
jgi:uncharacterized protein (TIGR00369 family)